MSDQDYEGLADLWSAIVKASTSGHPGPNDLPRTEWCENATEMREYALKLVFWFPDPPP